jgi:hypothetical protein
MLSSKVVTPAKAEVQCSCNHLIFLDAGACPGPDPGFAGMTFVVDFRLLTRASIFISSLPESFEKYPHYVIPAPYQVRGKLRRESRRS